ncbi:hypothetical protein X801_05021 [Opisthorchis viverrini]|uniref:Uncharacterized protein n=1 Tax=Opisthorchis viverrini TaxID=6198 RepID=A0A1S8WXC3_OPIVI|nr:hypothetical protein X801_05021 [Opisthorchis viverrini]
MDTVSSLKHTPNTVHPVRSWTGRSHAVTPSPIQANSSLWQAVNELISKQLWIQCLLLITHRILSTQSGTSIFTQLTAEIIHECSFDRLFASISQRTQSNDNPFTPTLKRMQTQIELARGNCQ